MELTPSWLYLCLSQVTSAKFWDFTLDEHGSIDLPTMVDYVLKQTNRKQLYYVGHSQGTVMGFVGLSEHADLQSKIKVYLSLSFLVTFSKIIGANP